MNLRLRVDNLGYVAKVPHPGNPAVYGYKRIIFFLLYIHASNHASDHCTKCAVMLRMKNVHTVFIVDQIGHFMAYLPPLFT